MNCIKENLKKHIKYLCLECPSRHCGSEAEKRAADYIEAEFKALGYDTVREEYPTVGWEIKSFSLWNVTKNCEIPFATPAYFSNSVDIEDKFVFIRGEDIKNLESMDIRGKLCFISVHKLGAAFEGSINLFEEKLDSLGAAGAVFMSVGHLVNAPATKLPRSPFVKQMGTATVSMMGAAEIANNPDDVYRLKIDARKFEHTSCNVIARHIGTNGMKGVIGAHYDSAPLIQGATDNASGTAAVIELARFMKNKYVDWSFDFCAFSAEEYIPEPAPLPPGSGDYVERHKGENIKWYLNVDGIGISYADKVLHTTRDEKLPTLTAKHFYRGNEKNVGLCGDDKSFYCAGIPTVWYMCPPPFQFLHTAEDSLDIISFDTVAEHAGVCADLFTQLAEGKYDI